MIIELTAKDMELLDKFNSTFSSILNYDIHEDFNNNIFTKYFIYMDNCNIIGFVNYYDLYDRYEIANIYVLSEFRRKKIGTNLLSEVISVGTINKIENITLEVSSINESAINLYKKFEFYQVAIRLRYYNGVDGILMERKMK